MPSDHTWLIRFQLWTLILLLSTLWKCEAASLSSQFWPVFLVLWVQMSKHFNYTNHLFSLKENGSRKRQRQTGIFFCIWCLMRRFSSIYFCSDYCSSRNADLSDDVGWYQRWCPVRTWDKIFGNHKNGIESSKVQYWLQGTTAVISVFKWDLK